MMNSALLVLLMLGANPGAGCCSAVPESSGEYRLCDRLACHVRYHKRLYYGHYDRHPFDYRFQFDYPWMAGPSQSHWPIPPLPACAVGPSTGMEWETHRKSAVNPLRLAQQPPATPTPYAAPSSTLQLRATTGRK